MEENSYSSVMPVDSYSASEAREVSEEMKSETILTEVDIFINNYCVTRFVRVYSCFHDRTLQVI